MKYNNSGKKFSVRKNYREEKRSQRLAVLLGFATLLIIVGLIFGGIPLLIGLANFLGKINRSEPEVIAEDTIPPVPPVFSAVPEATKSAYIKINGSSEPESIVEIYLNNELLLETSADEGGEFDVKKVNLEQGVNYLSGKAIDEAGNESQPSQETKVIYDNQAPNLEISQPGGNETVYQQTLEIKGKTESDEIKITVNDYLAILEKEGEFNYLYELSEGKNTIKVMAIDPAGNQTEQELVITYTP